MYANLIKEMQLKNIDITDISIFLGLHRNTISKKINGGSFSFEEAEKIRNKYFVYADMQYLFTKEK